MNIKPKLCYHCYYYDYHAWMCIIDNTLKYPSDSCVNFDGSIEIVKRWKFESG